MGDHVAFKCTFNNGDEGEYVGFNGTCTENIIKRNITRGHVWCSNQSCACTKYLKEGFVGDRPSYPCLESTLFRDWEFAAGTTHHGPKAGMPRRIDKAEPGSVVVLTTRFPDEDSEQQRRIIGLYRVGKVKDASGETVLAADETYRIRLPLEEARELYFWDYYMNASGPGKPRWGTGLFRYLSDQQVARIVEDLRESVRDDTTKDLLAELRSDIWPENEVPPASGALTIGKPNYVGHRARTAQYRKYGRGGEGPDHKQLKNRIAAYPELLGYTDVHYKKKEYVFPSLDSADVYFSCVSGQHVVVEVKPYSAEKGAVYQALKYRTLMCAENDLKISDPSVEAWVVAFDIPPAIQNLCKRYSIKTLEVAP